MSTMKILSAAILQLSLGSVANAVQHDADIYYHQKTVLGPSMWLFSGDGLAIHAPDGALLRSHRKGRLCPHVRSDYRTGAETSDCSYFNVASDGHRYVWAANHDVHRIDVFDIDTGDYAGYTDTCSTPLDMSYHPTRREMWIRCAAPDDDSPGAVDVISTDALSANHPLVSFNTTAGMRAYGRLATHSTLGNLGIATQYNKPHLTLFDLSSKEILETFDIPKAHASYDMAYSRANQHVYASVRVCCTCGTEEADLESCGRGDGEMVLVQTGPSAKAEEQIGVCSGGCKGSVADTVGVAEFDTVNGKFVGEHNSVAGNGCIPFASPDGRTVVLAPYDGGATVRVLRAGANGAPSTVAADVAIAMAGGAPGAQAVTDVAFLQDGARNLLLVAGSVDNDLVVVDMDDGYAITKVRLSANPEPTAAGNRQVEWAVGSDYVWVNGGQTEEMYVVEIPGGGGTARVVRTLANVPDGKVAFVNNFANMASASTQ